MINITKRSISLRIILISLVALFYTGVAGKTLLSQEAKGGGAATEVETAKKQVVHIAPHRLDQMEDTNYANYLRIAANNAQEEGADLIIIEIDTPGGELSATLEIKNTILSLKTPTVCFVNRNAISAGSLIAISCDKLVMAPGSVIGAATPVMMGQEGMEIAPEKIISASRAAWRGAAEARGRNTRIAEAFVDDSIVLTKKNEGLDKKAGKLLTLTGEEAVNISFADYSASSVEEILTKENLTGAAIERVEPGFKENVIWFLLHPIVSGLLLGLGFMGLLAEVRSPGWGIPGAFGLLFLSIYFFARIYAGLSGWEAPALFAFSILLILLEVFVIPGFGFAGILGIIGLIAAILWSYGISNIEEGLWVVAIALLGAGAATYFLMKQILKSVQKSDNVFLGANLTPEDDTSYQKLSSLRGKSGVAATSLRPSGTVIIDDERIDAVSVGTFIESGEKVVVKSVEGHKVVVDKMG